MKSVQNTPLKILLVDDDKDDRSFFEKALKQVPVTTELTTVQNGEQLMSYLSINSGKHPDVLFLDLNMPRKCGYESLAEISENEKLKELFVVIFSAPFPKDKYYEIEMMNRLLKIGAHHYLFKTHDLDQLKKDIHDALIKAVEKIASNNAKP
jgi:response regulator RpfG family c-di-GMP phosphodiesterase